MQASWLLLPILFPIVGGMMAMQMKTLRVRRYMVSMILTLQLLLVIPVLFFEMDPFVMLELAAGVRIVLQSDPLGCLLPC